MKVYHKSYLRWAVEEQGRLFDEFARNHPDSDTEDFINVYMNSRTRRFIDEGQAYVITMNSSELYAYFVEVDKYEPKPGKAMTGFKPDWIGRFYALYQWMRNLSSAETLAAVPLDFLKIAYNGLHDLELDLAVKKVAA